MIALRQYQTDAIARLRAAIRNGARRTVLVLPTGAGKTVIAAAIIRALAENGRSVLFLAPRRELVQQAFCKLVRAGLTPSSVGVIMAGTPTVRDGELFGDDTSGDDSTLWARHGRARASAPVQVASIDTVRVRGNPPRADYVIVDECHRSISEGAQKLLAGYSRATIIGLTATPYRGDGRGLGEFYDAMVVGVSVPPLVAEGFLVAPTIYAGHELPDMRKVTVRGGDYSADELDAATNQPKLIGDIVDTWKQRANACKSVAFASSIKHSDAIVQAFRDAGVTAEHLDGATPKGERDAILTRLRTGQTAIVSNCGVLCEGWDMPSVKCLILARPTMSLGLYLQMAGRILRPYEGQAAIILDHAGNVCRHGFPTEEREFTLDAKKKGKRSAKDEEEAAIKAPWTCAVCFAINPNEAPNCLLCCEPKPGSKQRSAGVHAPGELRRILSPPEVWAEIIADWKKTEEPKSWCLKQWRQLFNSWPPKGSTWE